MPDAPPHLTLLWGVIAGLVAAAASAVSYLLSRHHGGREGRGSLRLLVHAHLVMGAACLPLCWLLAPAGIAVSAWLPDCLPACLGSAGSYLLGQAAVFAALQRTDASLISPLLGLKIAVLAVLVACVAGPPLDGRQWLAVGLTASAVLLLSRAGGRLSPFVLAIVAAACLGFATADILIVRLIDAIQNAAATAGREVSRLHAGALGMAVTYVACGLAALPLIRSVPARGRSDWLAATQYSAAWLSGMVALYACFGMVGVVLGNILQSTRGLMSVGLGASFAHLGWHDLEQPVSRAMLARRVVAGLLMTAAIVVSVADLW
jgi:drug/metabolite transporter (DMT)-like permease